MTRITKGGDRQAYDPPARLSAMQEAVLKAEDVKSCGRTELVELAVFFADARDRAATPRERTRHEERLTRIIAELGDR